MRIPIISNMPIVYTKREDDVVQVIEDGEVVISVQTPNADMPEAHAIAFHYYCLLIKPITLQRRTNRQ